MTNRLPGHRSFATHFTAQRHNRTPSRNLRAIILPDSVSESKPKADLPLQYLKGVGPIRAQILARMGILSPLDLITTYPRDWQDRRLRLNLREAPMGEKITLRGIVSRVNFSVLRNNLGMATATLEDASGRLEAAWFKTITPRYDVFAGLHQRLISGRTVLVYGSIEWGPHGKQIRVEDMVLLLPDGTLPPEEAMHFNRIVPVYTVPEGLSERLFRFLVASVLPRATAAVSELLPAWVRQKRQWPAKEWALEKIHFPDSWLDKEKARETLAYEEFFLLETALCLLRQSVKQHPKPHVYQLHKTLLTPFREQLGFTFTGAQKKVIRELFDDLMSPFPTNRLIQGDVGSGKTVVALCAMLLAVENSGQAVLMAPTEILAEQHALTFAKFLKHLDVRWALLTGHQTATQRKKILGEVVSGNIQLVIGTHALLQKRVAFHRLMLIVIDEQHRFGVEHRRVLREKGGCPDVLVMTATPIPRTLALTLYGDLDVSILDEMPPGRIPITTCHVPERDAYQMIHEQVARGRQAYVVFPLVEESDKVELKAAVQEAKVLRQSVFRDLRVGVLHGQMPGKEKEGIMEQFRKGRLDVLIATSIIEVGIDVPNATVMAIQHAERFGLATLHQLRGRVGRGSESSWCLLIADPKTPEARRRIEVMTQTTDGFALSEEDLSLRGPGEILGVMQHGLPPFKIGNLIRDGGLIQQARLDAQELLKRDPLLKNPEHTGLKIRLQADYAAKWSLGSTG